MSFMFSEAIDFNGDISSWNVSNVTDMEEMFDDATNFNQDLGSWNVSKVVSMKFMFRNATTFNQDLSTWSTDLVTETSNIGGVSGCEGFSQNATAWTMPKPTFTSCAE